MSAYVVDKAHINAMINAGLSTHNPLTWYHSGEWHKLEHGNADVVGQMLLDENIRSVCARYEDSEVTNLPGRTNAEYLIPFKFRLGYALPLAVAIKQIHCYEYQSCETEDWEQTEAHALCRALEGKLIRQLPGYDDAPWGWTEWPKENLLRLV